VTDPAFSLRRIALAAFGPSLLFGLGEGAILPVLALSARELGASVPTAALVVGLMGIGSLVSNIPASLITMRRGERWAIVAAALWGVLAMALCALARHLGPLALAGFMAGSFMLGMAQAVFNLARQSYLTEAVPIEYRARALSTLGGVLRIGMFLGPFLAAAAILRWGLSGAYGVGVVALLLSALLAARLPDLPAHAPAAASAQAAPTLRSTLRDHRSVFLTLGIGVVLVSAVRASRQVVIPLWADHLMLNASLTSLIYGLAGAVDMLLFYPAGKVMDQKGRNWVAAPSMLIMGLALVLLPLAHGPWSLLLAALALGIGNGIGAGMIMTIGADHSPLVGRAHFLGVWRLMSDIGASSGPALLSLLTALFSLGAAIVLTGALAFAAAAQLARWIPRMEAARDKR
jgi:MFS family permease